MPIFSVFLPEKTSFFPGAPPFELLVFRESARVVGDDPIADLDDPRGQTTDELPVVADEDHRVRVEGERVVQRLDRFEVEVVGRLVQCEDVACFEHHLRQDQPRLFSSGDHLHRLVDFVAAEEHFAEVGAQFHFGEAAFGSEPGEPVDCPLLHVEHFGGVLREIAQFNRFAVDDVAAAWLDPFEQCFEQRGLAGAVGSDDGDLLLVADGEVEVFEERPVVDFGQIGSFDDPLAEPDFGPEADEGRNPAGGFDLFELNLLQLLWRLVACRALEALAPKRLMNSLSSLIRFSFFWFSRRMFSSAIALAVMKAS